MNYLVFRSDAINRFAVRTGYERLVATVAEVPSGFLKAEWELRERLSDTAGISIIDSRIVSIVPHEKYVDASIHVATAGLDGDAARNKAAAERDAESGAREQWLHDAVSPGRSAARAAEADRHAHGIGVRRVTHITA